MPVLWVPARELPGEADAGAKVASGAAMAFIATH
jgi:hypothetical protein